MLFSFFCDGKGNFVFRIEISYFHFFHFNTFRAVSYTHLDVYKRQALSDPYKAADETYYKILVPEKNSKGKGVRKGYLWVVVGINTAKRCCKSAT